MASSSLSCPRYEDRHEMLFFILPLFLLCWASRQPVVVHKRSYVLRSHPPLSLKLLQIPCPQHGELLVRTKACSVYRSDLHVLKGVLPLTSPSIVGHEITGEVINHNPLTDPKIIYRFPVGSLVVRAFNMPYGSCFHCFKVDLSFFPFFFWTGWRLMPSSFDKPPGSIRMTR
ncbi:SHSP domain-containing protein [Psidium guajava]|nr:SHSP domain-containing protein [Psidium guajava]